ncbi:MAG TPA: hypothetical protein VI704_03855 [Bacteroidota bacterium]|nr:hypothetical protein [Bacteroidota bacterium]
MADYLVIGTYDNNLFLGQFGTVLIGDLSTGLSRWEYPILGCSRVRYVIERLCQAGLHRAIGGIDGVSLVLGEIELRLKLLYPVAIF